MASYKEVGFRWAFMGLSSESKPMPTENRKVSDGVIFYEVDTSKEYVFYDGQWYEKTN